jgi:hypothetical protein
VGDHLGVGLRLEPVPFGEETVFDLEVVLDDPVVDDHQRAVAVGVGVGVLLRGTAMGSPARVADAERAGQRLLGQHPLEHLDAPGGAPDVKRALVEHRDARRVVATILEPLQSLDDDADRALVTDVADDPAHGASLVTPRASWSCAPPIPP